MIKRLIDSRRTSEDADYQTCDFTIAELLIYTDGYSSDVTKILDLSPTDSQDIGQVFKNSNGKERIAKINGWFLSSEGNIESKDLRYHLTWLLNQLEGKSEALFYLQEQVRCHYVCQLHLVVKRNGRANHLA